MTLLGQLVVRARGHAVLAEHCLLHLLRRRLRQLVDNPQIARDRERRDPSLTPSPQFLGRHWPGRHHYREDLILPRLHISRYADDRALGDGRVAEDRLLDLVRADVLATPAQRVLVAVDEVEPAVLVLAQRVTGVEPQVAPGLDGLLR